MAGPVSWRSTANKEMGLTQMNLGTSRWERLLAESFFLVIGVVSLSLAWNQMEHFFDIGVCFSAILLRLATLFFVGLITAYSLKILLYPRAFLQEFSDPTHHVFVVLAPLALAVLSVVYWLRAPAWSAGLWAGGLAAYGGLIVLQMLNKNASRAIRTTRLRWLRLSVACVMSIVVIPQLGIKGYPNHFGIYAGGSVVSISVLILALWRSLMKLPRVLTFWALAPAVSGVAMVGAWMAPVVARPFDREVLLWIFGALLGGLTLVALGLLPFTVFSVVRKPSVQA
ncbi:MAG: hypothetical protein RL676_464 [Pseudomonadota bacterium]